MKPNLGSFTRRGFIVAIFLCLSLGMLIFGRFNFTQQSKEDAGPCEQTQALEKEVDTLKAKIDVVEKEVLATQAKLAALPPSHTKQQGKQ